MILKNTTKEEIVTRLETTGEVVHILPGQTIELGDASAQWLKDRYNAKEEGSLVEVSVDGKVVKEKKVEETPVEESSTEEAPVAETPVEEPAKKTSKKGK